MKIFLFIFAWISFILGVIGAFLPVLPTTPFLILSAFLFSKSSPRFHDWLLNLPLAGEGIKEWRESRVIRPRAKLLCASMLLLSAYLIWSSSSIVLIIQILVSFTLLGVGLFVITRPSKPS